MSLVKANTYQDASGGSNAVFSGVASPPNSMGFRNRIINGNMAIDQRNAGAAVTSGYPVDRFSASFAGTGVVSCARSTVAPGGFTNSLSATVTTPDSSIAAGDIYRFFQNVEGLNMADLQFGSASASAITISFWVRSSVTGTYSVGIQNNGSNRSYATTYTVNVANTWEYKTLTIPGDTTGTWLTDNSVGIRLLWDLGSGSTWDQTANTWAATNTWKTSSQTNWISTNGATWYITGVQLEAGTNASPFERRDYGRELMMCQRYAYVNRVLSGIFGAFGLSGFFENTTTALIPIRHPVEMRASPTYSFSAANTFYTQTTSNVTPTAIALGNASIFGGVINATVSGVTAGNGFHLIRNNNNGSETTITASAEL
jgi:hypothetical protein